MKNKFDDIFSGIENDIELDDLNHLMDKVKSIKKKVKGKNKPKTITIPNNIHTIVREYCDMMGLNIGEWCASVLREKIEQKEGECLIKTDKTLKELKEEEGENILNKYKMEEVKNKSNPLIKSNYILMNNNYIFKGYSVIDGNPIYECREEISEKIKMNMKFVKPYEISKSILYNDEVSIEDIYKENDNEEK